MATLPCINHDIKTGDVNLLQVAGCIKGGKHARHHAEAAIKALKLPARDNKKIGGMGKTVAVGSYDEAVAVASHLGATEDQLNGIKEALKGMVDGHTSVVDRNFPIVLDRSLASWTGYSRLDKLKERVDGLIAFGKLILGVHVIQKPVMNLSQGREQSMYMFSKEGLKRLVAVGHTTNAQSISLEMSEHVDSALFLRLLTKKRKEDRSRFVERRIRDKLAKVLGGETEVPCTFGRVDVLTDTHVIEIKRVTGYKAAIGQVQVYGDCFPGKICRIHLFGRESQMSVFKKARMACKARNVDLTFEFLTQRNMSSPAVVPAPAEE